MRVRVYTGVKSTVFLRSFRIQVLGIRVQGCQFVGSTFSRVLVNFKSTFSRMPNK